MELDTVPVIDFSEPDRQQTAMKLVKAMKEVGFVYLDNVPGYDKQLEDQLLQASKWFFGLPLEEKIKLSPKVWNSSATTVYRGYVPINIERDQLREQYETGETLPDNDPDRLSGNPFYEATPFPYPDREDGKKFHQLIDLTREMFMNATIEFFHLVSIGLGLEEDTFDDRFLPKSLSSLRLMHYPTYEKVRGNRDTLTCEEHIDGVFVTLLVTFGYPGLEIEKSDGSWLPVPPRSGSLILNIGDFLENVTDHKLKAGKHRVKDIGMERYSLPFFVEPQYHSKFTLPDGTSFVYGQVYTDSVRRRFKYQFGHLPDYKPDW